MTLHSEYEKHLGTPSYTFDTGLKVRDTVAPIAEQTRKICNVHGKGCLGHIERNGDDIFMPSTITRSGIENEHALMTAKNKRLQNKTTQEEYKTEVVKHMRSKTGYDRSMNSVAVEGFLQMVISPIVHHDESTIYIPSHSADSIKIPHVHNGIVQVSSIKDGDFGVLVRQPVLWHGGSRSIKIKILEETASNPHDWNILSSMKVPISMCSSLAADYDGDQMTLFPIKSASAVQECKAALWYNRGGGPYREEDYVTIVPRIAPVVGSRPTTMALGTTMRWTDRVRGYKATKVHSRWTTTVRGMIDLKTPPASVSEFFNRSMSIMSSSTTKLSLQRGIGATSRRSKLGAERVFLDSNACMRCQSGPFSTLITTQGALVPNPKDGYFGNPTVRAISRLCRASMQITLKVKSSTSVSDVSPTLSFLSGSNNWLRILKNNTIDIVSDAYLGSYGNIGVTCSLFDISKAPSTYRIDLLKSFINIVCLESRCTLDPAEYECLLCLMLFLVNTDLKPEYGVESNINRYYGEFHTLSRWNMCYENYQYYSSSALNLVPTTLVEHLMLGDFQQVPSIAHNMT